MKICVIQVLTVTALRQIITIILRLEFLQAMIVYHVVFCNAKFAVLPQTQFATSATDNTAIPQLASVCLGTTIHSSQTILLHTIA
jgi:hypothetical protein